MGRGGEMNTSPSLPAPKTLQIWPFCFGKKGQGFSQNYRLCDSCHEGVFLGIRKKIAKKEVLPESTAGKQKFLFLI